jgi:HD-GYP domain-containing protein (c-di-GMP phosphodiesterase class II)
MDVTNSEAFWFTLDSGQVNGYAATWLSEARQIPMTFDDLRSLMKVFSSIVDAKSPFTKAHSDGVASLARYLGSQMSLGEERCDMLELAGLLHDIGKLRVPDELLDKSGPLTEDERHILRRHSFDTYNILRNIRGLEQVALWAGQHHERVDGTGYPYHTRNGALSLEARIIAVADVFQALAQVRPYRQPLASEVILDILQGQVENRKLDAQVVACIADDLQICWQAAMPVIPNARLVSTA